MRTMNLRLTPFETTLLLDTPEVFPGETIKTDNRGGTYTVPSYRIVKPNMPVRRPVSIEEFEADMHAIRSATE